MVYLKMPERMSPRKALSGPEGGTDNMLRKLDKACNNKPIERSAGRGWSPSSKGEDVMSSVTCVVSLGPVVKPKPSCVLFVFIQ